jgi:hypothetical protein
MNSLPRKTTSPRRSSNRSGVATLPAKAKRSRPNPLPVPGWADIQHYTLPLWNGMPGQMGSLPDAY